MRLIALPRERGLRVKSSSSAALCGEAWHLGSQSAAVSAAEPKKVPPEIRKLPLGNEVLEVALGGMLGLML